MIFPSVPSMVAGLIIGCAIAVIAFRLHALSRSGAVAAAVLGAVIFGVGGPRHTAVLLVFFFSSSLLSQLASHQKIRVTDYYSKGSRRDAWQVLANGGAAGALVIAGAFFSEIQLPWWMYCASVAAANADTWATELGAFSRSCPRLITNFQHVETGTSGGITLLGTFSALAGAGLIALTAAVFTPSLPMGLMVVFAGLLGSLIDSTLGASIQGIYWCEACGKETEKFPHHACGNQTRWIRGWRWLNNDWVNAACTVSAPVILVLLVLVSG